MARPLSDSCVDVALWFMEQATGDEVHLQPIRLQRLLFLAQLVFAERHQGAMLMPANFVIRNGLPVEANIFRVFESTHPLLGRARVPGHVESFLDEVWQQRTVVSMRGIEEALHGNAAYRRVLKQGEGSEVTFNDMREIAALEYQSHAVERVMEKHDPHSSGEEVLSDGRKITAWTPRAVSGKKHFNIETIKRR